ncbi:DNA translocase FtsK [Spirochaeta dissipatitropha]
MSDLRQTDQSGCLQALVLTAAGFLTISFILSLLPYQQYGFLSILAAQPGRFLYRSFSFAGLIVPAALYVSAMALRAPRFRFDWLGAAVLSVLPMASLGAGLRLALSVEIENSVITAWAEARFGSTIAAWFFLSLAGVLAVCVHQVSRLVRNRFIDLSENPGSLSGGADWKDRQRVYEDYTDPEQDYARDDAHDYGEEIHRDSETGEDETQEEDALESDRAGFSGNSASLLTPGFNRLVMSAPLRTAVLDEQRKAPEELSVIQTEPELEPEIEPEIEIEIEPEAELDMEIESESEIENQDDLTEEPPVIHVTFPRPASMVSDFVNARPLPSVTESADAAEEDEDEVDGADVVQTEADFELTEHIEIDLGEVPEASFDDDVEEDLEEDTEEDVEDESAEFEEREREARILEEAPPPKKITRGKYAVPIDGLLDHYENTAVGVVGPETRAAAQALKETLKEFNIDAEVTGIRKGPVITMFEILPAPGVKLAKITSLADNIALRLAAQSVRIVAPIPGKHAVGIEIPNHRRSLVGFGELLHQDAFAKSDAAIPLALGKDIPGDAQIVDLARTPHLLIAGATGSGKSVCVNSIICSILYRRAPEEVRLILIDPKIVELKFYNDIPHLLTPVITDPKRAFQALQYAIYEMERRYSLLDAMGVRDLSSYNRKIKERKLATANLPYIVIIVDEFADLMATSGKELESTVARLCAMSRAVGIHLVLATQRPSTDVITGLIKANIPSRIAFMVASKVDSRIIIDTGGAEKLLGRGDMLFTSAWDPFPFRMQGAFLTEDEVERVVAHVKTLGEPDYIDDEIFIDDEEADYIQPELEDPLMEKAVDIVVSANKASASYLQRRLKIGYNRAARLVEEMERMGIVGPQNGSKARDVIGSAADM